MWSVQPVARISSTHWWRRIGTSKMSGYQSCSHWRCWLRIRRASSSEMPIKLRPSSIPIERMYPSPTSRFHFPEQKGESLPTLPLCVVNPGNRTVLSKKMSVLAKSVALIIVRSRPTRCKFGRMNPWTNGQVEAFSLPVSVMKHRSGFGSFPCAMSTAIAPDCVPPPQLQTSVISAAKAPASETRGRAPSGSRAHASRRLRPARTRRTRTPATLNAVTASLRSLLDRVLQRRFRLRRARLRLRVLRPPGFAQRLRHLQGLLEVLLRVLIEGVDLGIGHRWFLRHRPPPFR